MISVRSELRRRVLTFFYLNRKARVYVRQLAAALGVDSTNLSRELKRLEIEGLLRSETEGRQVYYSVNSAYPYLKPFFALLKGSIGIEPALREALQSVAGVESAWLTGSFAKGEQDAASDIDLLIVGEPDHAQLAESARKAERALRREINYTVLTPRELRRRLKSGDAFLADVWNGDRVELIGPGNGHGIGHGNHKAAEDRSETGQALSGGRA
jgi:predicted nucleotidyltransferase